MLLASFNLLDFLLWLVAGFGVIVFAVWLSRFLDRFALEPDTRLLAMIAFVGVVLFGVLNFLWSNDAPPPHTTANLPQQTQEPNDLNGVLNAHFPELQQYRTGLKARLGELQQFFNAASRGAQQFPHQVKFLQNLVDIHWVSHVELKKVDTAVDLSLNEFWLHYTTGEQDYVILRFQPEAATLTEQIKTALSFDNTGFNTEQVEIQKLLTQAMRQLEYNDIPLDPKNRKKPIAFAAYTAQNQQMLLEWLQQRQEQTLLSSLISLQNNQQQINSKLQHIQDYVKNAGSNALAQAMQKVIVLWQHLSLYNQYAQYQVLFAVESEYLQAQLQTFHPQRVPDQRTLAMVQQLHAQLLQTAPQIAQRAQARRVEEVERSYSPTSFFHETKPAH